VFDRRGTLLAAGALVAVDTSVRDGARYQV